MKIKLLSKANSAWVLLAGAVALAALMSFAVLRYLQERERSLQEEVVEKSRGGPKVDVVVPMRDVPAGTPITRDVFVSRPIDADLVYPDTVTVETFEQYASRNTIQPILQGRPLRLGDMDGGDRPLAAAIPKGFRAITVTIDSNNSLANMIRPGDFVDLYLLATPTPGGGATRVEAQGDVASLLLQKVTVLATGKHVFNKEERLAVHVPDGMPQPVTDYDTLTLQASPEQSAKIALATKVGSIRAVLRGSEDRDTIAAATLATHELFPSDEPGAQRMRSVQYIVGGTGDAAVTNRALPDLVGALAASRGVGAATIGAKPAAAAPAPTPAKNVYLTLPPGKSVGTGAGSATEPSLFFPQTNGNRR